MRRPFWAVFRLLFFILSKTVGRLSLIHICSKQAVPAAVQLFACVHQQKAACAVGVFCLARGKARLAEQCGLLVASNARDLSLIHILSDVGRKNCIMSGRNGQP